MKFIQIACTLVTSETRCDKVNAIVCWYKVLINNSLCIKFPYQKRFLIQFSRVNNVNQHFVSNIKYVSVSSHQYELNSTMPQFLQYYVLNMFVNKIYSLSNSSK